MRYEGKFHFYPNKKKLEMRLLVPGAGFEPATSGLGVWHPCSPDYESGALARLGYPGFAVEQFC